MPGLSRTDIIVAEVMHQRSGIWDAYDQGRWAFTIGTPRGKNPHSGPPGHVNEHEWERGWDDERARAIRIEFATEPTEQGNQYVIPGCEKDRSRGPAQGDLF